MAVTFNTNVSALTAQRYMASAGDAAASSLSKLSSGSRVPTAKDDAAGLAIGTKLKAEVSGLQQAGNNAAQAVSLLQIADGALSTTSDILQRMKSLAVQSASGQLSDSDRSLLNQEFTNLKSEVDRIANVTNFNGTSLLKGGGNGAVTYDQAKNGALAAAGLDLKVDTGVVTSGDAFRVSYDFTDNGGAYNANTASTYNSDTYNITVTNINTGASQTINAREAIAAAKGSYDPTTNLALGQSVDVNFTSLGVTLNLNNNFDVDTDIAVPVLTSAGSITSGFTSMGALDIAQPTTGFSQTTLDALQAMGTFNATTGKLQLNMATTGANNATFAAQTGLRFAVNGGTLAADNTASANVGTAATAFTVDVYLTNGGGTGVPTKLATLTIGSTDLVSTGAGTGSYQLDVPSLTTAQSFSTGAVNTTFSFKVGTGTTANDDISFSLTAARLSDLGLSSSTIATSAGANAAISSLNTAIGTVASRRADVGAAQSRLGFASDSIAVAIENTTSAQSAILDVDVSSEITTFTSKQVLLQAGVSLLAQANQQPALLLRLLQ